MYVLSWDNEDACIVTLTTTELVKNWTGTTKHECKMHNYNMHS